ncbi:hypothetical protein [Lyngbya sp. PCC 8106]|uniref:hypothetical protein n=1 Tax=Lyngbya sp. (strain PCC 8106) TaxID=313612 RepID=UPI0000EA98B5|nr:hypothetical protein [Lyngbya sp. PCC 8106]EAW35211.1 hypothetical protein L8106_13890 [Lyngbya sp. PCC 8106]
MYVIKIKTEKDICYAVWTSSLGKKFLLPTSESPEDAAKWKTYSGAVNALDRNYKFLSAKGEVSVLEIDDSNTHYKRFNVGDSVIVARIKDGQTFNLHEAEITKRSRTLCWVDKDKFTVSSYNPNWGYGEDNLMVFDTEDDLEKFRLKNSIENLVKQIEKLEYSRQLEEDLKQIIDKHQQTHE